MTNQNKPLMKATFVSQKTTVTFNGRIYFRETEFNFQTEKSNIVWREQIPGVGYNAILKTGFQQLELQYQNLLVQP